jgi:hypothetical protein
MLSRAMDAFMSETPAQDSNVDTKIIEAARSGLPMRTAAMEKASLCEQMKS